MSEIADRLSIRIGGLIFSGISFFATLPLVFVVTLIVNNFFWGYPGHIVVVGSTWMAFILSLITGALCLIFPSPKTYFLTITSLVFTGIAWLLWFTPLTRNLLH